MKNIKIVSIFLWMIISHWAIAQSEITISVDGICGMCKDRIEATAINVIGVTEAEWILDDHSLTVVVDDIIFEEGDLHAAMAEVGHDTNKMKASDIAYDNLHGCCKYRDEEIIKAHGGTVDEHADHDHAPGEGHDVDESDPEALLSQYVNSHEHTEDEIFIHGMVYENLTMDRPQPLIGANIRWEGGIDGTVSDFDGFFELPPSKVTDNLVISYVGYEADTINMKGQSLVAISLQVNNVIDNVTVTYKKKATEVSFLDPIKVHNISQKELCKAACCSLSESFETNPAIDVTFTDAVTGTRKIEMLGLAGPYVQVMRENMPYIRGIASVYGFEFTPGPWIESIQLNMGSGSVVNGPERMTGQINVELKKPQSSEKLYVNLYANNASRLEANVNTAAKVNDKWTTGLLLHGSTRNNELDRNSDGFYDSPIGDQIFAVNRWRYNGGENGYKGQFGIKGTYVDKTSGQVGDPSVENLWRAPIKTERFEGWAKLGKVFEDAPYKNIGMQFSVSAHDQSARFGSRDYQAKQNTIYGNLIYSTIILDTDRNLKLGASFLADKVEETVELIDYKRTEQTVGAYAELQEDFGEKVSMVLGIRGDYSSIYGFYATPRFHLRYNPSEATALRLAVGRGQRTASVFAENIGLFASNREIVIDPFDTDNDLPYGLRPEVTYNIGASITKEYVINQKSLVVGLDYYYTTFEQQVVVDYDIDPQEVHFYNLDGKSYSHSIQAQMDYELLKGVDVRVAYRYNDVKTDYKEGLRQKQLTSKHRAFVNSGVDIGKGWEWDGTLTWQGPQRLPDTDLSPEEFRQEIQSPDFLMFNTQVTKNFKNALSIYLGAENVFDYRQDNPIVNGENPFNDYFDSSMIWGPVMGRNVYVGLRYAIQ